MEEFNEAEFKLKAVSIFKLCLFSVCFCYCCCCEFICFMNRVKPDASKVENVENVAAYILFSSLCIAVIIKRLNSDLQTHKSDKSTFLNSFSNVEMFYTEMLNSYTILAILRKDTWFIPKITITFSKEMLRALTFTGLLVPIKLLRVPLLLTIDQLIIFC
jgi:hypothetical protein